MVLFQAGEQRSWQLTREQRTLWRRHIGDPRSLIRLASNPFMLTMIFIVWYEEGELPRNRGDLFSQFTYWLLSREKLIVQNVDTQEGQLTQQGTNLLDGLADLAWSMQMDRFSTGSKGELNAGVLTAVSPKAVIQTLRSEDLFKKALDCTILEGTGQVRFRHQLLQEYFTAKALQGQLGMKRAHELWPAERWWKRTGWEEAAVLLAGFYPDDCSPVIRWLAGAQPEVAAQCVLESGAEIANKPALLRELQSAWLPRLTNIELEPAPESRAAIGRALGRLGLDDRKGVGLRPDGVPDIDWVTIPGGEFAYQQGERKLETFWMSRYPITNAQFQAFLEAHDGYKDDRWWKRLDMPDRTPQSPSLSESNCLARR